MEELELRAKVNTIEDLSVYKGIAVIVQHELGKLLSVSLELLGEGRKLADKVGCPLYAVILGNNVDDLAKKLSGYGADKVFYYEHPILETYTTDGYTKIVSEFVNEIKPESVLFCATSIGRDFAPRVAARVGTGLTADCTALDIDETDKKLLQTRPAFGGNLMATIICPKNRPQMATIRPGVMQKAEKTDAFCEILKPTVNLVDSDIISKTVEIITGKNKNVSFEGAEIIVSGGRGVGGPEGFKVIDDLAKALGGVVGASRAAIEAGWIASNKQIGQTGHTVRPKIYIACGISGAIQHCIGMSESDYIIAINKNSNAPIMSMAHLAIEGDLFSVIPELINEIDKARE